MPNVPKRRSFGGWFGQTCVSARAPAKINLGLAVGARRADGFHDLQTVFSRINLHDDLTVEIQEAGKGDLSSQGGRREFVNLTVETSLSDKLPSGKDNLCVRAAEAFWAASGLDAVPLNIMLSKRIPIGAGLGGGSSDAASVLKCLNRILGQPLSIDGLSELAAQLGSDVPFFLHHGVCSASGRGEKLRPIRIPKLHILLYVPNFQVNTAWAYRELDDLREDASRGQVELTSPGFSLNIANDWTKSGTLSGIGRSLTNSFEPVVFRAHPELGRLKTRLLEAGAVGVLLSGSGSAMFAIVRPERRAHMKRALKGEGIPLLSLETVTR